MVVRTRVLLLPSSSLECTQRTAGPPRRLRPHLGDREGEEEKGDEVITPRVPFFARVPTSCRSVALLSLLRLWTAHRFGAITSGVRLRDCGSGTCGTCL